MNPDCFDGGGLAELAENRPTPDARNGDYFHSDRLALSPRSASVALTGETWLSVIKSASVRSLRLEQWLSECVLAGHEALRHSVEINPQRRGGIPVLTGTRFTVAQTLAELAESSGVDEIADRFELDKEVIRNMPYGLSLLVNRPCL
jgi:uncharacterized protein (DUF433 family)